MIRWMALPFFALMGCTASAELQSSETARADRDLAKALEGRTAGASVECVSTGFTDGPQVIDRKTILYRQVGKIVWRNDLEANCPGLDRGGTIILEIHGSQMCKNDRFRVLQPGSSIPSLACRLGKFTPYRK